MYTKNTEETRFLLIVNQSMSACLLVEWSERCVLASILFLTKNKIVLQCGATQPKYVLFYSWK